MGGTRRPETNDPAALLLLCATCHAWVESNRTQALEDGLLVRQNADPRLVPVRYRGRMGLLGPDGLEDAA